MKIAIMLRHLDEYGDGVMKYTKRLLAEFFKTYRQYRNFLLYKTSKNTGEFGKFENVHELILGAASKPTWDQATGTDRIAGGESLRARIIELGKIRSNSHTWEYWAA
jgi:hypothetical protein